MSFLRKKPVVCLGDLLVCLIDDAPSQTFLVFSLAHNAIKTEEDNPGQYPISERGRSAFVCHRSSLRDKPVYLNDDAPGPVSLISIPVYFSIWIELDSHGQCPY